MKFGIEVFVLVGTPAPRLLITYNQW